MDNLKIKILGCGLAMGIPNIEFGWGSTNPNNTKNRRTRTSINIIKENVSILVDTSPDLYTQAFYNNVSSVDAVIYTHAHADHFHGVDAIRSFNRISNKAIDCYFIKEVGDEIEKTFPYVFKALTKKELQEKGYFKPSLIKNYIKYYKEFEISGIKILPTLQNHGYINSTGFIIDNFVYATDVVKIPEETKTLYKNKHTLILGVLGKKPHPAHMCLDEAIALIDDLKPEKAYLTHLGGSMDFDEISSILPKNVHMCYDGLEITVPK